MRGAPPQRRSLMVNVIYTFLANPSISGTRESVCDVSRRTEPLKRVPGGWPTPVIPAATSEGVHRAGAGAASARSAFDLSRSPPRQPAVASTVEKSAGAFRTGA